MSCRTAWFWLRRLYCVLCVKKIGANVLKIDVVFVPNKWEDGLADTIMFSDNQHIAQKMQTQKRAETAWQRKNADDVDPKERVIKGNTRNGDYVRFGGTDEQGIAYGDIMAIQAHDILTAITEDRKVAINIAYGHYVDTILKAMAISAREGRWVKVSEVQ